jgi:hypothetical protein
MAKKKHDVDNIIERIGEIRSNNNKLWMAILKLGFDFAPKEARKVMKIIVNNDKEITKWLGKL